ncbi:hypothetical protein GI374_07300 [Paracoccus sp. S-4012]|uniref:hypothetical protein n=1 Tax=Paracoccus sp. S-4012 TaxID=2665648 RepID=UPI0012AF6E7E|nr:hypothetical protein [Paracoccus sp. S-4012]MRX50254.1 hypothetical protein [Paracoccus sp. S-4012]
MIADSAARLASPPPPAEDRPRHALAFDLDAVHLMEDEEGAWVWRGAARYDAPDLQRRLDTLRRGLEGPSDEVALLIPEDQVLFTNLTVDPAKPRREAVARALEGVTPYPVAELAFDWVDDAPDRVRVATVWRGSLREYTDFASEHGFTPMAALAEGDGTAFPGEARFWEALEGEGAKPRPAVETGRAEEATAEAAPEIQESQADLAAAADTPAAEVSEDAAADTPAAEASEAAAPPPEPAAVAPRVEAASPAAPRPRRSLRATEAAGGREPESGAELLATAIARIRSLSPGNGAAVNDPRALPEDAEAEEQAAPVAPGEEEAEAQRARARARRGVASRERRQGEAPAGRHPAPLVAHRAAPAQEPALAPRAEAFHERAREARASTAPRPDAAPQPGGRATDSRMLGIMLVLLLAGIAAVFLFGGQGTPPAPATEATAPVTAAAPAVAEPGAAAPSEPVAPAPMPPATVPLTEPSASSAAPASTAAEATAPLPSASTATVPAAPSETTETEPAVPEAVGATGPMRPAPVPSEPSATPPAEAASGPATAPPAAGRESAIEAAVALANSEAPAVRPAAPAADAAPELPQDPLPFDRAAEPEPSPVTGIRPPQRPATSAPASGVSAPQAAAPVPTSQRAPPPPLQATPLAPQAATPPATTPAPTTSPRPPERPATLGQAPAAAPASPAPPPRRGAALSTDRRTAQVGRLVLAPADHALFAAAPASLARGAISVAPALDRAIVAMPSAAGPRFAQARPPSRGERPQAASSVDAAVAAAVASQSASTPNRLLPSDRPSPRPRSAAASAAPASTSAVEGAIAAAIRASPAAPGGVALTALRSSPFPQPAPRDRRPAAAAPQPPAAAAPQAADQTAAAVAAAAAAQAEQRRLDEQLQAQAEERARAASAAQIEAQQRAAAEARARAQAEAEMRAAAAARQPLRHVESDNEPELSRPVGGGTTSATVASGATASGIDLNRTTLIGVVGAGKASRGLIRLRNGRIVTVRLGDRIDGGPITEIGKGAVTYVQNGRPQQLRILEGR